MNIILPNCTHEWIGCSLNGILKNNNLDLDLEWVGQMQARSFSGWILVLSTLKICQSMYFDFLENSTLKCSILEEVNIFNQNWFEFIFEISVGKNTSAWKEYIGYTIHGSISVFNDIKILITVALIVGKRLRVIKPHLAKLYSLRSPPTVILEVLHSTLIWKSTFGKEKLISSFFPDSDQWKSYLDTQ